MVYPRNAPLRTGSSNARLDGVESRRRSTSSRKVLGHHADGWTSDYGQPKRPLHDPKRYPSESRNTKKPRLTDTHWGLFDQFMERNAPKEFRK